MQRSPISSFFFFNDTATTEIYTLSLHDALPISSRSLKDPEVATCWPGVRPLRISTSSSSTGPVRTGCSWARDLPVEDRKSTRLNSSHSQISYAVFCLKKKNNIGSQMRVRHYDMI